MKTRYSGLDLACQIAEMQKLVGMRINKIYDIDKKTYLLRMQRTEEKSVVLIESGSRIHETNSVWPKNDAPSGFTMKLRKHLKNKRLEELSQYKSDRIVVLKFGMNEVANYLVVELYDRGNILLLDHEFVIISLLRPRLNDENNKMVVRETYDLSNYKTKPTQALTNEQVSQLVQNAAPNDTLKKLFVPHCPYGPAVLEHLLLAHDIPVNKKKKDFPDGIESIISEVLAESYEFLDKNSGKGIILQKVDSNAGGVTSLTTNVEFHPFLFRQHSKMDCKTFDSFNAAVDEFFSGMETQKIDVKVAQQERQALKKLDNIKQDHLKRLTQLEVEQAKDRTFGELIELNCDLVDKALTVIRTAIANQIDWTDIEEIVAEAGENGDPILSRILKLKLDINHFTMMLSNPFEEYEEEEGEPVEHEVELDIDLTAQANARKYYDKKKSAALKEQKTLQSHSVAMKSAEKKTKAALREVAVSANIIKARKTYWFEKFYWFISSENYLVIAGRDQQQNEHLVKRYMAPTDIYVHADLHGASSVIIKNPTGKEVPPKTLNEAGQMAVCYSAAWDSKVVTSAYWVESSQVSKTAPTGEYLTTGSFMIRGKKNYLPPSHLILGFGILFKLGDDSLEAHRNERKVRTLESEISSQELNIIEEEQEEEKELEIAEEEGDEEESSDDDEKKSVHEKEMQKSVEQVEEEQMQERVEDEDAQLDSKDSINKEDVEPSTEVKEEASEKEEEEAEEEAGKKQQKSDEIEDTNDVEKSSEDENSQEFPDTTLAMNFSASTGLSFKAIKTKEEGNQEDKILRPSFSREDSSKTSKKAAASSRKASSSSSDAVIRKDNEEEQSSKKQQQQQQQTKQQRGKKGKAKKIREKYKDQDEAEKELRMQLLHNTQKDEGKRAKKKAKELQMKAEKENKLAKQKARQQKEKGQTFQQASAMGSSRKQQSDDLDDEAEDDAADGKIRISDEVDMIDALTGIPVSEDELMFAVAVIGPYNAMTNYKYKVKVTPGTAKRGKAAKTTLSVFGADRAASGREKDLLKSLKDQDVSRNLPGKVKISAPQLQKSKAKAKNS